MTPARAPIAPDLLAPPDEATVARALDAFAAAVRRHYGARLVGLYLFGSRARGDHTPESDADVAVVLRDEGWDFWREKRQLIDLAFDHVVESGLYIQPWPFRADEWGDPAAAENPSLVAAAKRDAREIEAAS